MATESPQRRWQALCPNCGAPVEFASAASASAVCSFCRSTLLRDGETLRKIGTSAELIEDYSPLQLGAAGRYAGEAFTVVGRLQHRYAEGAWNEWHALFEGSGRSAWLSEDNGSFVMAFEGGPLAEAPPPAERLQLGGPLTLDGRRWSVAAITPTTLAAAEGELPRPPMLGASFKVVELRNEQDEVGSLEYLDPNAPQWSVGRAVRIADLAMRGLRDAGASKTVQSRALSCPNCGAPLEPRLGTTVSIVCPQCRHVVDLTQGIGAELQHFAQSHGGEPQIPLGTVGSLAFGANAKAVPWQLVGYQERCDIPEPGDDDETTFWREYLLFNASEGFVFLVDAEDGWSLVRPLTGAPQDAGSGALSWQGRKYRRKYDYQAKTTYVLGEFYWQLKRGEQTRVSDFESAAGAGGVGKAILSREQTAGEVTWSQGLAIDAAEVIKAFRLPQDQLASLQRDATPTVSPGSLVKWIIILFVVLPLLIFFMRGCGSRGSDNCQQYATSFGTDSAEYQQCLRSSRSSTGGGYWGGTGGSYGGYSSGGGGHK